MHAVGWMAKADLGFDGGNSGSIGVEYRTSDGPTLFFSKLNKSCDSCNGAKRKCDRKLPCRYE